MISSIALARQRQKAPLCKGGCQNRFSEPILTEGLSCIDFVDPSGAARHLPLRRGGFGAAKEQPFTQWEYTSRS